MTGPKIYFTIPILGGIPITQTLVSSFVVMVLLCVAGILLGRNLQKRPSRRQVLVEKGMSMLYDMVRDTMGEHNLYWTPYIGALFLSSLGGTLIGMTGVFRSATADLSTTGTWAIMTSVLCWGCGIRANGFRGWLKGFADSGPGDAAHEHCLGDLPAHLHGPSVTSATFPAAACSPACSTRRWPPSPPLCWRR